MTHTGKAIDAIEFLETDHQQFKALLEKIAATTEKAAVTRQYEFARLKLALDAHSHIEETVFYPAIQALKGIHKITLEGIEEHAVMSDLLNKLAHEDYQNEQWTAKFKVMKENTEHHLKEEEEYMFPECRKILDPQALLELGTRMQAAKQAFIEKHR